MVTEGAEDAMAEALRPCTMAVETHDVRILMLLCTGLGMIEEMAVGTIEEKGVGTIYSQGELRFDWQAGRHSHVAEEVVVPAQGRLSHRSARE